MAASDIHERPAPSETSAWVWDHDRRRIVWANEAALRFWGERNLLDLIERDFAPTDQSTYQFAQLLHAVLSSDVERVRGQVVLTPVGRPQRVEAIASPFTLSDGRTGLRIEAFPAPIGENSQLERLHAIFENTPHAMALFAEDGSLLQQNAASAFVFGDTALRGLAERYGERKAARDAMRALLVGGSFSHSAVLKTRVGPRRHRVTMRRMLDPVSDNLAALAIFSDTAEREESLMLATAMDKAAESAVLSVIQAGVAVYDDALKPLYMSDLAKDLLGVPVDSAAPQLGRLFPRDRERISKALVDIRDGHSGMAEVELAVQGAGGAVRWVKLQIKKGGWRGASAWVATITDVTGGRRAAVAVQRATDDRDVAMGLIGVGTVALREDGTVGSINAVAADLLGWSEREAVGKVLTDAFTDTDAALLTEALAGGGQVDTITAALAHPKNNVAELSVGISPLSRYNRNHRILALRDAGTAPDMKSSVFDRKEAVARASHELRTPLNAIIGFTQLMLEEPGPITSPAYVDYLQDINDSGAYMLRLLQDLLDLRSLEVGTLALDSAPIEIGNLLRIVGREVDFAAKKRDVEVTVSVEPDLPAVLADMHTMRQAITNIVSNAVKYTALEGWVRISAVQRASGAIEIEVIDNGEGMTAEELVAAMKPFAQMSGSHRSYGGAGMGLPLAKGFIEANRARFEFTSEKHLGTIARIVFPPNRIAHPD